MSTEELKAAFRRVYDEAWHKGNMDVIDELHAVDYVRHQTAYPDVEGLEAYKQYVADVRTSYPDVQITIDEIIAEGNTTAARWTFRGTQTGQSPTTGAPPTGKQVTFTGCLMTHWVEGKIVEEWPNVDWLSLLQQLGVVPPLG